MSTQRVIATIRARIKDIDRKISELRAEQKGLEAALSITLGETELVEPAGEGKVQRLKRGPGSIKKPRGQTGWMD